LRSVDAELRKKLPEGEKGEADADAAAAQQLEQLEQQKQQQQQLLQLMNQVVDMTLNMAKVAPSMQEGIKESRLAGADINQDWMKRTRAAAAGRLPCAHEGGGEARARGDERHARGADAAARRQEGEDQGKDHAKKGHARVDRGALDRSGAQGDARR
jgi:hypothetical protein